jgi:monothiol glutaredoxin
MAVNILQTLGVKFKTVDVFDSEALRQGIKDFSDWPTIPQLYIKQEFRGGSDIMREMYETGELLELVKDLTNKIDD